MVKGYAKTEQVQTTLTRSWRERLDAVAERREQSRADGIRDAIENWVEGWEFKLNIKETK